MGGGRDRGPYTTFRQAWIDIRATVSGDARVHTNLAERLEGLVASLVLFKDEKVSSGVEQVGGVLMEVCRNGRGGG